MLAHACKTKISRVSGFVHTQSVVDTHVFSRRRLVAVMPAQSIRRKQCRTAMVVSDSHRPQSPFGLCPEREVAYSSTIGLVDNQWPLGRCALVRHLANRGCGGPVHRDLQSPESRIGRRCKWRDAVEDRQTQHHGRSVGVVEKRSRRAAFSIVFVFIVESTDKRRRNCRSNECGSCAGTYHTWSLTVVRSTSVQTNTSKHGFSDNIHRTIGFIGHLVRAQRNEFVDATEVNGGNNHAAGDPAGAGATASRG